MSQFFHSTEFFVILFVVATAIVVFATKPRTAGPVREELLAGILRAGVPYVQPTVEFRVAENGMLMVIRRGIEGINMSGAVSAKVDIKGFTIHISERIVAGKYDDDPVEEVLFMIDSLARERYFIRYESDATSTAASVTMRLEPGASVTRDLVK